MRPAVGVLVFSLGGVTELGCAHSHNQPPMIEEAPPMVQDASSPMVDEAEPPMDDAPMVDEAEPPMEPPTPSPMSDPG